MNTEGILQKLYVFCRDLWTVRIRPWMIDRRAKILVCSIVGIVAYLVYTDFVKDNIKKVEFYVGGLGGKNAEVAHQIQRELDNSNSLLGKKIQLEIRYTQGYKENYELLREDIRGERIAFAYDGMNALEGLSNSDNVRMLVPLQWSYLHIIANNEFLDSLGIERPEEKRSLKSIVKALITQSRDLAMTSDYPKFFLGDNQSATRDLSRFILKKCGIADPNSYEVTTVRDFADMQTRLKRGELDLAFYTGPNNSSVVSKIAESKTCSLIGLNEIRDAITSELPFLRGDEFKKHSYLNSFCSSELKTLLTRKAVVCSQSMKTADAYLVGMLVQKVLEDEVDWNPGITRPEETPSRFDFKSHPGSSLVETKTKPMSFPNWLKPGIPVFFAILLSEILAALRKAAKLEAGAESQKENAPSPEGNCYDRLSANLEAVAEGHADRSLSQEALNAKLQELHPAIVDATKRGALTGNEAAILFESFNELLQRVSIGKKKKQTKAAPKTKKANRS